MSSIDWLVMFASLLGIAAYGAWKTRSNADLNSYFRASGKSRWFVVGVSVMATQASAITFLSTPGQAYSSGMGFVQFYFGLPLALIIVSFVAVPVYHRLKVITAYQFLEERFDRRVRQLAAFLFLVQRGFAAGLTIYAPSIIFSSLLGWDLDTANVMIGSIVILYTVIGGTRAVNVTQLLQMSVILCGMFFVFAYLLSLISGHVGMIDALHIASAFERTQAIDLSFDINSRYTLWSGLTGGLFLSLSYFGTDQSQVQRYVSAESADQSRMGLMFNAVLKIPMQLFILSLGVLVFILFQFEKPPLFFNQGELAPLRQGVYAEQLSKLESEYDRVFEKKKEAALSYSIARKAEDVNGINATKSSMLSYYSQEQDLRKEVKSLLTSVNPSAETKDTDYVFLTFIVSYLPQGLVGLLLAAIICAAMSSTAGELNALASTTVVDFYQATFNPRATDAHLVRVSRIATLIWGLLAISFATFASLFENLIQAVNIVGSLFYGTILGIFVVAFGLRRALAHHVFYAAIISEAGVLLLYVSSNIGFLWFNFIGCFATCAIAYILSRIPSRARSSKTAS
jgi:Na+/proline symporter